jgi:hypothetical protein
LIWPKFDQGVGLGGTEKIDYPVVFASKWAGGAAVRGHISGPRNCPPGGVLDFEVFTRQIVTNGVRFVAAAFLEAGVRPLRKPHSSQGCYNSVCRRVDRRQSVITAEADAQSVPAAVDKDVGGQKPTLVFFRMRM